MKCLSYQHKETFWWGLICSLCSNMDGPGGVCPVQHLHLPPPETLKPPHHLLSGVQLGGGAGTR